jgi:hypothetical protein
MPAQAVEVFHSMMASEASASTAVFSRALLIA